MKRLKLLVTAGMVAASLASMAYAATPALATDEFYPHPGTLEGCGKCAQTSGPNNYIKNNESYNYSGEGFCDAAYLYLEKVYYTAFEKCYSSGKGITLCNAAGEFWGHGQTRRYYAMYEYNLIGRQDNFSECK